jgi:L-arabinose isomerase
LAPLAGKVTEAQIRAELEEDRRRFNVDCDEQAHRRSLRIGLALRQFMNEGRFDAFSANFLAFDRAEEPINAMPFLEASKAMARGLGYAGEGDVLTAALVAGLLTGFEQTTFTEIFCPDWKGNSLFLSHMGEINPNVAAAQPLLLEKPFPYTPAKTPAFLAAAPAPGPAVYVNLTPGPADEFRLIVTPVEVLEDGKHPGMQKCVRGWIRPRLPIAEFLEQFSRLGGTHHSALVLGEHYEAMAAFGRFAGLDVKAV